MTHIKHIILALLFGCHIIACNNDIFVEDDIPTETKVVIPGDGGSCSVRFQPKRLTRISFDVYSAHNLFVYYDKSGNVIKPESPASELGRISYTGSQPMFDVVIDGKNMTFNSVENATGMPCHYTLRMEYDYKVDFIEVEISPGRPSELIGSSYDFNRVDSTLPDIIERYSIKYTNNSPSETTIDMSPYLMILSQILIEPNESWAKYVAVDMAWPVLEDGEWTLGTKRNIKLGVTYRSPSENIDQDDKVPVVIPAYSSRYVTYLVSTKRMKIPVELIFCNPVSGRQISTEGVCRISVPYSYEVYITEE